MQQPAGVRQASGVGRLKNRQASGKQEAGKGRPGIIATISVGDGLYGVAVTPDAATVDVAKIWQKDKFTGLSEVGKDEGISWEEKSTDKKEGTMKSIKVSSLALWLVMAMAVLFMTAVFVPYVQAAPFAYISNYNVGTVSVIDLATNTVTATVVVGGSPAYTAVHPDGTRVATGKIGDRIDREHR